MGLLTQPTFFSSPDVAARANKIPMMTMSVASDCGRLSLLKPKEEMGRQHQGMDRPGVQQVPEGTGEQGKIEKTGSKIICGAPTTLAVKGLMMMMMI